jgi:hypothetical protein
MIFHDVTIQIGSISSRRVHDTTTLVPAAVEIFRLMLEEGGENFRVPMPVDGIEHIELNWTQLGSAAVASFFSRGVPVTTSALASGLDDDDDRRAMAGVQSLVMHFYGDSPAEPGFDLSTYGDRPAIATLAIPVPVSPDIQLIADMETCLAAAFFLSVLESEFDRS